METIGKSEIPEPAWRNHPLARLVVLVSKLDRAVYPNPPPSEDGMLMRPCLFFLMRPLKSRTLSLNPTQSSQQSKQYIPSHRIAL